MSKELRAFRKICRCLSSSYEFTDEYKKNKKLIEEALKNYQELLERPCVVMPRASGKTNAIIEKICKFNKEIKITNLVDENKVKAFDIIKENLVVSYDESNNDKPCLMLGVKVDKDKLVIIYETFDEEKIDLLKRVLL